VEPDQTVFGAQESRIAHAVALDYEHWKYGSPPLANRFARRTSGTPSRHRAASSGKRPRQPGPRAPGDLGRLPERPSQAVFISARKTT
jgi:hypothetical protein